MKDKDASVVSSAAGGFEMLMMMLSVVTAPAAFTMSGVVNRTAVVVISCLSVVVVMLVLMRYGAACAENVSRYPKNNSAMLTWVTVTSAVVVSLFYEPSLYGPLL